MIIVIIIMVVVVVIDDEPTRSQLANTSGEAKRVPRRRARTLS
jgi:hypothetical protein